MFTKRKFPNTRLRRLRSKPYLRDLVRENNLTANDLIQHFTVNVVPHVLLIQLMGPIMEQKGWGRIVVGSSIGVKFGGGRKFNKDFIGVYKVC